MIQDTVPVVLDTLKTGVDSLAVVVGTAAATQISTWVTLVLSVITKFGVDFAKRLSTKLDAAPAPMKALAATGFGQAAAWVTATTGVAVNPDITAMQTTVGGLVVAFSAMGVHAGLKALKK